MNEKRPEREQPVLTELKLLRQRLEESDDPEERERLEEQIADLQRAVSDANMS